MRHLDTATAMSPGRWPRGCNAGPAEDTKTITSLVIALAGACLVIGIGKALRGRRGLT